MLLSRWSKLQMVCVLISCWVRLQIHIWCLCSPLYRGAIKAIVYELCDLGPLSQVNCGAAAPVELARHGLRLMRQAAEGLAFIHSCKLVGGLLLTISLSAYTSDVALQPHQPLHCRAV